MFIYLAARFARWPEIAAKARELEAQGHTITSRWHNGSHTAKFPYDRTAHSEQLATFAVEDLEDIDHADALVLFTEHGQHQGGSRHVEAGYAIATKKRIFIVGPRENVFYHLDQVCQLNTWEELKAKLRKYHGNQAV